MSKPTSICVFCGSQEGKDPAYAETARAFGALLAENQIRFVYGGGGIGLMGIMARACHGAGGVVTGVIPDSLATKEIQYQEADEKVVTPDMHTRRQEMYDRSDAFVVFPGGVGTLEEMIEVLSWATLGIHTKPMVLFNEGGYWDPLVALLRHTIDQGFTTPSILDGPENADALLIAENMSEILPLIEAALTYQELEQ